MITSRKINRITQIYQKKLLKIYRYYQLKHKGIIFNVEEPLVFWPPVQKEFLCYYPESINAEKSFCCTTECLSRITLTISYSFYLLGKEFLRYGLLLCRIFVVSLNILTSRNEKTYNENQVADIPSLSKSEGIKHSDEKKPLVFVSVCENEYRKGGDKYNGGINELNCLVKLLRRHGYSAYMVTYDGTFEPWLFEHQDHISIADFKEKISSNSDYRCVTSFAVANEFIRHCDRIYFWDMELTFSDHCHFSKITHLDRTKIANRAGISRTVQAWHMANFHKKCVVLPNLLDDDFWKPDSSKRINNRIGYMNEGLHTQYVIQFFQKKLYDAGLDIEFIQLRGETKNILEGMQSCNIFISMNLGKDLLWGEGCPRTIIEALSTGAVVLAYDIIGNREILIDSFNGIIVPRYNHEIMIEKLIELIKNPEKIDLLRKNGLNFIESCHTLDSNWPAVCEFLDING